MPVVFTGLSIGADVASQILKADYRPPIRRGDLENISAGSIVVIIDGVFDSSLAVSPTEIRHALQRGVEVFGASSMGALRAVEVPGMVGIGRVFDMFRSGEIENDDEVAIIFDAATTRVLSEPLVNVRHAANRLAATGTIGRDLAGRIIDAAAALPYFDRNYAEILKRAGLEPAVETQQLARMLASIDLKREDAISVLEYVRNRPEADVRDPSIPTQPQRALGGAEPEPSAACSVASPVNLWEFGSPVHFREIVDFLAFTGVLMPYAERAYGRLLSEGHPAGALHPGVDRDRLDKAHDRLLATAARAWQWATEEEVTTSLADLGIKSEDLYLAVSAASTIHCKVKALIRGNFGPILRSLRLELFLDDLVLKRETARLISMRSLAAVGEKLGPVAVSEREDALHLLCRMLDERSSAAAFKSLEAWGVTAPTSDNLVTQLVFCRRMAPPQGEDRAPDGFAKDHRWLRSSPKQGSSRRFCASLEEAHETVTRLQPVIGVTRVAMITGLGTIGIPNAQAFRPDGQWSSTVGSGKSESDTGAKIGAVMEELEKWSQERFAQRHDEVVAATGSYRMLDNKHKNIVNPALFDLPHDTCYRPDLKIDWYCCEELISGDKTLAPAAAFTHRRLLNDIYYSPTGARKTVTTNGLAAGMTMAEALTHALCEFIERHARSMDMIAGDNPGVPAFSPKPFVDLATVPESVVGLVKKIASAGYGLVLRDIAADIRVPTFFATIFIPNREANGELFGDGWQRASGWAAHPDPEAAAKMAILEASQTVMSHIAGAREDLALHARSLGRHERTDSRRAAALSIELDRDIGRIDFSTIKGFTAHDTSADVRWILARLAAAGCDHVLAMEFSTAEIAPVSVVRVVIPGLETINPFYTGPRARRALIADLLPAVSRPRQATFQ